MERESKVTILLKKMFQEMQRDSREYFSKRFLEKCVIEISPSLNPYLRLSSVLRCLKRRPRRPLLRGRGLLPAHLAGHREPVVVLLAHPPLPALLRRLQLAQAVNDAHWKNGNYYYYLHILGENL